MENQNTQAGSPAIPEVSLEDMSLAVYREQRSAGKVPAAAPASKTGSAADAHATGEQSLGDNEAQGGADDLEHDAGADQSAAAEANKPNKKGGWQRKIDKLERENNELKQKLAAPAAGAPAAASTGSEAAPAAPKAPEFSKPKPQLKDFDSIEKHTDATVEWALAKRDFETRVKADAEKAQTEAKGRIDLWNTREAAAKQAHSDYDDVLASVADVKVPIPHQLLFLESEHGAEIAYDLASDADELKKFVGMNPTAAAKYFGRLEAKHEASASSAPPEETQVSRAPRPARSVSGRASGGAAQVLDAAKLDADQYRAAREGKKTIR